MAGLAPVRLGVIGCGFIGQVHIAAATRCPGTVVAAVCDIAPGLAERTARETGAERAFTDATELIGSDVDAVVVALPAVARHPVMLAALAARKDILVEKPAAASVRDIDELIAAQRGQVVGACSARFRTPQTARAAAAVLARDELGELRSISVRGYKAAPPRPDTMPPPWRLNAALNGGGMLWNWGPYDLDFVLGLTGWSMTPTAVFGQTWPISGEIADWVDPQSTAETHSNSLVRFSNGCVLNMERGEYLPTTAASSCLFTGTKGSMSLNMTGGSGPAVTVEVFGDEGVHPTLTLAPSADNNMTGRATNLIGNFVQAVRDRSHPLTTLENSRTILTIVEAIRRSGQTGTLQTI
jgi:predicted dehydrogenase